MPKFGRSRCLNRLVVGLLLLLSLSSPSVDAADQVEEAAVVDPDVGKTVVEIVKARGYAIETHQVTTSDRYVLTLYRIPKSYKETQSGGDAAPNKPAVHLQHGMMDSSFTFVCNFRNQSLPFVLADAGFDVWLGNNRGSTWSRKHLDLSADDDEYWDFSWEEMGLYDIPAFVEYILKTTGRKRISYVGHSEGTTQAFVSFSKNQTLAKKIDYFGALAPIAWTGHATNTLFVTLAKTRMDKTSLNLGFNSILPNSKLLHHVLSKYVCNNAAGVCDSALDFIAGPSDNFNSTRIQVYLSQMPAGASMRTLSHYGQGIRDNTFTSYDFGCKCLRFLGIKRCPQLLCKNKKIYGDFDPPAFPLGKMVYPRTGIYTGGIDNFATAEDIEQLRSALPSGTIVHDKEIEGFSHLDFVWAQNANERVYQDLVVQLKKYAGKAYPSK